MFSYASAVVRFRVAVMVITLCITAVMGFFASQLHVVIDPVALAPQAHPLIKQTHLIDRQFGSKYMVLIGVTQQGNDPLSPLMLDTVRQITDRLMELPGIVPSTLMSLAAPRAKWIDADKDSMLVTPLLPDRSPSRIEDRKALLDRLNKHPMYKDLVASADGRTAIIMVELKERSDGFTAMMEPVHRVLDSIQRPDLTIRLGGNPVFLETTERFAQRIEWLFPLALLLIGWLHFEAFRTLQGFFVPLVTALLSVVWGMGWMGVFGQQMDIFNSPTPILILAIAAGHSVQLLKRYYESYQHLREACPQESAIINSRRAVIESLCSIGPVMWLAGVIAACGFLSLLVFDIASIRAFGIFTAAGILSAVVLELTFTPALRASLPAPKQLRSPSRWWSALPLLIVQHQNNVKAQRNTVLISVATCALLVFGCSQVVVDNAAKRFFSSGVSAILEDDFLNHQTGGTQSLYIMVDGGAAGRLKDPALLKQMDLFIERARQTPEGKAWVGKALLINDFIRQMNQSIHGGRPDFYRLPDSAEQVAQYLLLYGMSGSVDDFDAYVDYSYQTAKITLLLKTGSNAVIEKLVAQLQQAAREIFPADVQVSFGGDVAQTIALTETMVQGKLINIAAVAAVIVVLCTLVFRSLLAGLLVLLPLSFAVLSIFGVMGLFGIPLNIPNALIAGMAVGIGSDYAIYLLYRIREFVQSGMALPQAIESAMKTAGQASLFVASAVAGGYSVLALSYDYRVHTWLAMFIVIAMFASVLATLYWVPLLVRVFKPDFVMRKTFDSELSSLMSKHVVNTHVGVGLAVGCLLIMTLQASEVYAQGAGTGMSMPSADVKTLVQKSDDVTRYKDSTVQATFTMTHRDGSQRIRKTVAYTRQVSDREQMRLIRFLSPQDIKGTATLMHEHAQSDDDIWVYLPALGKTRRLSAAQKKDAFMGTDLSYADVLGHRLDDWSYTLIGDTVFEGMPVWVVQATPMSEDVKKNTGYSLRTLWLRKDSYFPVFQSVNDIAGQALKESRSTQLMPAGKGQWAAYRTEVRNLQTGHSTVLQLDDLKTNSGLATDVFSLQALER